MEELQDRFKLMSKTKSVSILNQNYNEPITCLTAYSSGIAKLLDGIVDIILIGDSLGSTLYGMKNSRGVTLNMMKLHGLAVNKSISKSITILDMPFNTYRNKSEALRNAKILLNFTKSKMLKLEINDNIEIIKHLSDKKINVVAHLGVTPQSFTNFSKIKAVGKKNNERKKLIKLALESERAGAKIILLECVFQETAKEITSLVQVPTIGIGSSKFCDGQVLVFDDLINIKNTHKFPKFVKNYLDFDKLAKKAIQNFNQDVKKRKFPSKKYSYQ